MAVKIPSWMSSRTPNAGFRRKGKAFLLVSNQNNPFFCQQRGEVPHRNQQTIQTGQVRQAHMDGRVKRGLEHGLIVETRLQEILKTVNGSVPSWLGDKGVVTGQ